MAVAPPPGGITEVVDEGSGNAWR